MASPLRRRILKISAIVLASLLGLVGLAIGGAIVFLQGDRMGAFVTSLVPEMRGKLEFRSIRWPARLLFDILAKRPTPLVVEGVKFYDPEGSVVLDVPHLTVGLELRQLIDGGGLFMHDLDVGPNSYWRFGRMQKTKRGIGFLEVFKAKKRGRPSPPKPPGAPKDKGFVVRIYNAQLNGLRVVFDFPHVWGFDLRDVHAPAWLHVEDDFVGWEAVGLEARAGGFLTVLDHVLPFDSVKVKQVATLREYADDIFLDLTEGKTGRSTLVGKGFFNGIYADDSVSAIHMHTEFHDAPDALTAVLEPLNIPGLRLGGDQAHVNTDLMGPYVSIAITTDIGGLDVSYDQYTAQNLVLRAGLQFDPKSKASAPNTKVEELSFSPPGGGRVLTKLDLAVPKLQTHIKFDRFNVDSYLPASLRPLAAGQLHGQLSAGVDFDERMSAVKQGRLHSLALTLDRTGKAKNLPRSVRLSGQATASPEQASTSGLRVDIPGAGVEVKGKVEFGKGLLALGLRMATTNLPQLLSSLGVPPLAQSASLDVDVSGTMTEPRANGQLRVKDIGGKDGIPSVPSFETKFRLHNGTLQVEGLDAQVAAGSLSGSGSLKLFEKSVQNMLRSPSLQFRLDGHDIDLQTLVAGGLVSGKLAFEVTAQGSLAKPKVRFKMPPGVTVHVLGQTWQVGGIDAEVDKDGLALRLLQVSGKGGGDIQIEGHMRFAPKTLPMEWRLRITDLPVEAILAAAQVDVPATGKLTIDLRLTGTSKAPLISGRIDLKGAHAMGVDLGDAMLQLTAMDSGVGLQGNLFGRFDVQGTAKLAPDGLHAQGRLSFANLKLEEWGRQLAGTPELEDVAKQLKDLDLQSALSGQVEVALEPGKPPLIHARLTELASSIRQEVSEPGGQISVQRLGVKNDGELRVSMAGDHITLDQFCLSAEAGKFCVQGGLDGQALNAKLLGALDLELLQPLVRKKLERMGGAINLEVMVGGTLGKPLIDGKLAISRPVTVLPVGFDSPIFIPSGVVHLRSDALELKGLALAAGGALLKLDGRASLGPNFTPKDLDVQVNGEISATILETLAPDVASDVTGRARVDAKLTGTLDDPKIAARIELGEIQMRLRGMSNQIAVESGTIELTSKEALLRDVKVRINDEGRLLIGASRTRPGRLRIVSLRPELVLGKVELPLTGERLSYRTSGMQIDDLAFTLNLSGDLQDKSLSMVGDVRLVSGRYVQDFNVRNLMISARINESDSRSFWEDSPLLEDLKLDLRVRTLGDGFIVQNNLAPEIFLQVDLRVGGTLSSPTLAGDVRPTEGRFHIIGLRGDFELVANVNHITFVPTKSLAAGDTPELNLEATNQMTDAFGNQHTVQMRISGPISQATIDLSTTQGLDRNQTLMLLLSGRTTETTNLVGGSGGRTIGVNTQSGIDVMGQASRDAVSNLIEPYVDDTLQLLTGHKVNLRPTVGADGFELKLRALASRELAIELSYLYGFQSQAHYRASANAWIRDYITGNLGGDYLTYAPRPGLNNDPIRRLYLELRLAYPLRFLSP